MNPADLGFEQCAVTVEDVQPDTPLTGQVASPGMWRFYSFSLSGASMSSIHVALVGTPPDGTTGEGGTVDGATGAAARRAAKPAWGLEHVTTSVYATCRHGPCVAPPYHGAQTSITSPLMMR